ncbi:MAG: hypothetical protein E4H36_06635 [Spirochaetales bacterium]|nr:MAG: hypothetical protein E4H36_06635 [Spirochaetales bacterium]
MKHLNLPDYETFRRTVLEATGVSFCTRLHFGRTLPGESERYIRFSYSGIDTEAIEEGIHVFRQFVETHDARSRERTA